MSAINVNELSGVSETLLITLYIRALETQRPDAQLKDEKSAALVSRMDQEFLRSKLAKIEDYSQVAVILRSREFDRLAQDFLGRHPRSTVVLIGCGLDSRFERVDNGLVEWYDLDLPDVIDLRRRFIGEDSERYHLFAYSVLDDAWLDVVGTQFKLPFLFLAEGVFMYFDEIQVKSLVLTLKEQFIGAELVFDTFSPFTSWTNNLKVALTGVGARSIWAPKNGQDLERWNDGTHAPHEAQRSAGIYLLGERFPFQYPEQRLGRALTVRRIPFFSRMIGIYHFELLGGRHV